MSKLQYFSRAGCCRISILHICPSIFPLLLLICNQGHGGNHKQDTSPAKDRHGILIKLTSRGNSNFQRMSVVYYGQSWFNYWHHRGAFKKSWGYQWSTYPESRIFFTSAKSTWVRYFKKQIQKPLSYLYYSLSEKWWKLHFDDYFGPDYYGFDESLWSISLWMAFAFWSINKTEDCWLKFVCDLIIWKDATKEQKP